MSLNALNGLNRIDGPGKMPNSGMEHLMVYVELEKVSISNQSNQHFAFKPDSFLLKITILP